MHVTELSQSLENKTIDLAYINRHKKGLDNDNESLMNFFDYSENGLFNSSSEILINFLSSNNVKNSVAEDGLEKFTFSEQGGVEHGVYENLMENNKSSFSRENQVVSKTGNYIQQSKDFQENTMKINVFQESILDL